MLKLVKICSLTLVVLVIFWILWSDLGLIVTYRILAERLWTENEPVFQKVNAPQNTSKKCLCIRSGARLGNNMFAYASALGIARHKGMRLVASTIIREWFTLGSNSEEQIELWGRFCETAKTIYENDTTCNAFDKNIWNLDSSQHTRLSGCLRSWKYFVGKETAVRDAFTFRDHIHITALKALRHELANQGKEGYTSNGGLLVAVHVRRGDRVHSKSLIVPPKEYFQRAMAFMRKKFRDVMFVVCSDDLSWSRANLFSTDVLFIDTGRAEVDFRVLSLCNHTIMSVGTFGWWAAWLANGTTVYYKNSFVKGLGSDVHTNMNEYMPRHWLPML